MLFERPANVVIFVVFKNKPLNYKYYVLYNNCRLIKKKHNFIQCFFKNNCSLCDVTVSFCQFFSEKSSKVPSPLLDTAPPLIFTTPSGPAPSESNSLLAVFFRKSVHLAGGQLVLLLSQCGRHSKTSPAEFKKFLTSRIILGYFPSVIRSAYKTQLIKITYNFNRITTWTKPWNMFCY